MSNLLGAEQMGEAMRVPVWTRRPEIGRFTAWGAEPVWNDEDDIEEAAPPPPPIDLDHVQAQSYSQGYAAGIEVGRREAEAERARIAKLAAALEALKPEPTQALGAMIADTVARLVAEVVGKVSIDRETLLFRAQAAAALIGEETRPAVMKLNPDDIDLLGDATLPVATEADASLPSGTIRLETASGWIEDGPAVRLEKLRASLDRIAAAR